MHYVLVSFAVRVMFLEHYLSCFFFDVTLVGVFRMARVQKWFCLPSFFVLFFPLSSSSFFFLRLIFRQVAAV